LGEPDVAVRVALDVLQHFEIVRIEPFEQSLGQNGNTVVTPVAEPLDDGAYENVRDLGEPNDLIRKLFGDERQGCTCCLPDSKGKVARLTAHGNDKVPTVRRLCVDHEALNDADAHVTGRVVAERRNAVRKVEVVVDGFGHVDDADTAGRDLIHLHRAVCRVVSADCDELVDVETEQGGHGVFQVLLVARRVIPRRTEVGAASEVDTAHLLDRQRFGMRDVTPHDVFETDLDPNYFVAVLNRADRCCTDHTVDTRGRTATYEDGYFFWSCCHNWILFSSID